jgi:hypothetical protein
MIIQRTGYQFLFIYTVSDKLEFWVFAEDRYYTFADRGGVFSWVGAAACLPEYASGQRVKVPPERIEQLRQAACAAGITLHFYTDLLECELAESCLDHPDYIFDLQIPAGFIVQKNQDHPRPSGG